MSVGFAPVATAQTLDRSVRPVAPPAAPFHFPNVVASVLPNGLRLAVVENHALPVVAVRVVMAVDSLVDPPGKEGLFALTQLLLRDGTTTRSADSLASDFISLGDGVTASGFTLLSRDSERALGILADLLQHPAFPQAALDGRTAARVGAIRSALQSPYTAPRRMLYARLFGPDNPVTRSVAAGEAAAASITRDDVAGFYERYFKPGSITIVISGDVNAARMREVVGRLFGGWPGTPGMTSTAIPAPPPPPPTTIYLIDRPAATQSYVYVGQLGPMRTSPDVAALETLAPILGAIPGSRLHLNLRDRHRYTYAATPFTVSWRPAPIPSMLWGFAAVSAATTDSALVEWIRELRDVRGARPITAAELAFGRSARVSAMPARIETTDSVATRIAELVRDRLPFDFYDRYVASIQALTPADVTRAAAADLHPDRWIIVVAGDRARIEAGLRATGIGPVVIVDESGAPAP